MNGKQKGTSNQWECNQNATYFHCASYKSNHALSKLSKVPDIYSMVCLLQALRKFFVNSPKREQELERHIKSNVDEKRFNTMKNKIKPLCETRWVEKHTAFEDLHLLYKHVLDYLKSNSQLSKKKIICFNDSPSKMMKNAFYFILKALFVLKIFKFLSWFFGHVEKTAWSER